MALDLDKYNDEVKQWGTDMIPQFKSKALGHGIRHRENSPSPTASISKFRNRFYTVAGVIERISLSFPRSLIYPHKGAGKGRGGTRGSRWVDKYGNAKKTNPESYGKMGTGGRVAKPFINDALAAPDGVDKLATIAAENLGDALAGSLFIK